MKLTKTIREAFVRAAMADVPQEDFKEQIRAVASKGAVENLPPKVRAVWNDPETRTYIRTSYFRFGTGSAEVSVADIPTTDGCSWHAPKNVLSPADEAKLDELSKKHNAQHGVLESLRAKLVGAANSVSTRKALADLLPEFERYLPADEAAANRQLPVVTNLVADFAKAGWPKSEKKGKRAAAGAAA